jgi:DNA-binding NarL/FixJ family response regulator
MRVVLADDHEIVRKGIRAIVNGRWGTEWLSMPQKSRTSWWRMTCTLVPPHCTDLALNANDQSA